MTGKDFIDSQLCLAGVYSQLSTVSGVPQGGGRSAWWAVGGWRAVRKIRGLLGRSVAKVCVVVVVIRECHWRPETLE